MLTTVERPLAAGINNVEWDAVELPSQFMENWCYHRETLLGLSRHVETGEPLPDELFEKLVAARTFRAGSDMLRQLYFATLDLELHQRWSPDGGESVFDVQRRVAARTTVLPPLPEDRFLCGFSHIFAGGYAAGYYSYKWAEVLSADAFAAFEEAGLDDPRAVARDGPALPRHRARAGRQPPPDGGLQGVPRPRAEHRGAAAAGGAVEPPGHLRLDLSLHADFVERIDSQVRKGPQVLRGQEDVRRMQRVLGLLVQAHHP